jgi:hypothetical protein
MTIANLPEYRSVCRTVFNRFTAATWPPAPQNDIGDLRWFFATRQVVEGGDLRSLSVMDLDRFREARRAFARPQIEALYGAWVATGDRALNQGNGAIHQPRSREARLVTHELSSTYSQFGTWPGVC